ncbi:hypothetical protein [Amycolatopsis sp. cmx-8-4]|uniref:hypothetical protein n=1 Tax=Amycolatopsis sp. cmx-8-4 TaxID=2790947 RepID=UPI00397E5C98
MSDLTAEQLQSFFADLETFKQGLAEQWQKDLLDSIVWLASKATSDEGPLAAGFVGSFTPHQAAVVIGYASGTVGLADMLPQMIRSFIRS